MKPIKSAAHLPSAAAINPGGRTTGKHTPPSQSPKERAAEVAKASEAGKGIEGLGHKVDKLVAASEKRNSKAAAAKTRAASSWVPSGKELEKHTGSFIANVSLPTPKTRHASLDTGVVKAGGPPPKVKGAGDTPDVRPDVPELNAGGLQTKTSYREPPKKPKPDTRGACRDCGGALGHHRWTAAGRAKLSHFRTPADIVHPGVRSGTSGVGSKPTHLPNFSTAGTPRANKPSTQSSSAGVAERGAVGKAGSEKRDIKDRNIEKPEKKQEGFTQEVYNFLEAKLHVDWETKAKTGGIFKFNPTKSTFEPLKTKNPLPPGASPSEKAQAQSDVERASANLGIIGGKRVNPKPTGLAAAKKDLFGEDTMNPDKIANDIIREAFTSGDRKNTTPADNTMSAPGGTQRQMLAGEFVGSAAWPFDQSSNDMYDGSAELQASQAKSGMGNGQGDGFQEAIGKEIVDNLLEDSPSAIYSDTESVGYLINELRESGYSEQADTITAICEDAKEEDVVKVVEMMEKLEADKADAFLVEQLAKFANLLIEDDDAAGAADDSVPSDPNTNKEDAGSEVDTGKDTGGSGL